MSAAKQHAAADKGRRRTLPRAASWALLTLLGALLALSTWFAATQPPHPDMLRPIGTWDFAKADWWLYPLERNAFRRTVIGGDLNDVFALPDSNRVWAVGNGGLIVHSDDGGRTWRQQRPRVEPGPAGARAGASSLLPISSAHAADAKSLAQQPMQQQKVQQQPLQLEKGDYDSEVTDDTAPAGKSPSPPTSNNAEQHAQRAPAETPPAPLVDVASADLHAVFFVDARRGWAVGYGGTVIATTDGGASWQPQASGTQAWLTSITFTADGQRGWAVGGDGAVIATTDGGATWQPQASGTRAWLNGITFTADGQRGWAVGDDDTVALIATTDGGASWQPQTSGTRASLLSITFTGDGQRGWAVGAGGTVIATTDGGASWQPQASGTQKPIFSITFTDGQRGWAVGDGGTVIATTDGGASWQPQASGTGASLLSITFTADGQRGWAVGEGGTVITTTDGGASWQPQASGTRAAFGGSRFTSDGQRGWAVGDLGTVIATVGGGAHWQPQASGTQERLYSITVIADGQRGWAVGAGGTVLGSTDGGATWQPQASGTQATLESLTVTADGQRVWAVGGGGTVLATNDGGARWQPQASGTDAWLTNITVTADGQRGWAVGAGGTVIATTDGGASWQPQASGTQESLLSITFAADGQRGWAVGTGGTIIATTDGGVSWQPQASGTQAALSSITFAADGQRGWVVGGDGTLIATPDGGASWQPQASGTDASLTSITFAADGQRGWAVGDRGTVLATTDGGASWQAGAQPRIGLAPWYWLTLLLLGLTGVQLGARGQFGRAPAGDEAGPTHSESSSPLWADRPVEDLAQDRLHYRPTVQALSGFIRNAGTEPHLTLAITGEWGQGKSSVMRMLKRDLEQAGFRTAWFNAWHHQQEGRPMSALFNVIRRQAMPSLFSREAIAALRVRWRLLWGRGGAYRVTFLLVLCGLLVAGQDFVRDYTYKGIALSGGERLRWSAGHHLLGKHRVRLTPESLTRLTPVAPASGYSISYAAANVTASNVAPAGDSTTRPLPAPDAAPANPAEGGGLPVRQQLFEYLRTALVSGGGSADTGCRDPRPVPPALSCVFDHPEQLFATIDKHAGLTLTVDERRHLSKVAPPLPAPPLLPRMEWLLLSLGPLLALLLTKGLSVYGFQLLRPLNGLVNRLTGQSADEKEPTGLIEHYRTEFALLTQALDGRLVLFMDDLDRCSASTVNSLLELTNYLTDIGQCFIVLGVAIEHIEDSVAPNRDGVDRVEYARRYLRKLIHVEVPVPHRMARTDRLYDAPASDPQDWTGQVRRLLGRWLPQPVLLGGLATVAFAWLALPAFDWMNASLGVAEQPLDIPAVQSQVTAVSTATPAAPIDTSPPPMPDSASAKGGTPMLITATRVPESVTFGIVGVALIGTLLLILAQRLLPGVASSVNRALGRAERTFDSAAFVEALRLWHPALVQFDPTPRGVKRFANRARLMALYERLSAAAETPPRQPMAEEQVVAVTAIHQVEPDVLHRWANERHDQDASTAHGLGWVVANANVADAAATARRNLLLECFNKHTAQHGEPGADDIDRLRRRMQDVKVR